MPFRIFALMVFVPALTVGLYHRLRVRTTEKLDRRQEGIPILISLRLIGLSVWVSLIAWLISPRSMAWSSVSLPDGLRMIGLPLGWIALAWIWWVLHSLGSNLTDTVVTRREHTLVQRGPYRWIRHPLYTMIVPFGLSFALLAANWYMGAASLAAFLLLAIRSRKEEENLVARFGDAYRNYMAATGRFLPKL
ncbi:MAG: isoprenylcysteine carboxylmethyltransferase family protein [Acidobacteriia bacterium]|nr:isoprenylcysteine carboxylmethyltransferase family protein [Terriglobia bacterium]